MNGRTKSRIVLSLMILFIGFYYLYSNEIMQFYDKYLSKIKILLFIILAVLVLFVPFNPTKIYRITKTISNINVDSKYDKWLNERNINQMVSYGNSIATSMSQSYPMSFSGGGGKQIAKRNVNGYKKRIIAANQNWKCGHCNQMLDAAFEVDHIIALSDGGTNDDENLVCLCRRCHGVKTFKERADK